ncbi:MAG: NTP transferase domain-containing protein, partial [Nitrospinaceae bacterium]|nr:NTP transferase domain-containing protein [Nitrospinaceae bacterium]NIR55456.1 NTP transferase domain-containing protein [Nitrospinaceae bacterium]NIS85896.1 NTP transferase domain-containing protein [Nitrospinaceae bacterium]NIT82740.1 NTP transferase domain-containing protein [Nitrospinaceae bacterium]NIU44949.1 NTP transferase domain-containing protein [Nitrospinaceae bacterium]
MDAWRTSDLDAVILCGGRGRRLQSVVRDRPKPLAIVQGRPFLDYVIDHAARFGVRRFILAAGFQSGLIQDYCRNRPDRARFQVVEEPHPLGTGGAVKFAEPFLQSDVFLILNGDS